MLSAGRAVVQAARGVRGVSNNPAITRRNVMRKMKLGIDRLPSQGPDPAAKFRDGWRLAAAAVVERYPVVIPEQDPFEAEYLEGRFLEEQRRARPILPEMFLTEKDLIEGKTTPSEDDSFADMYTPGPRVTEADKKNDVRSLNRALDKRLYLVVRRTDKSPHMQFPQTLATDSATPMGQYAQQALRAVVPTNNQLSAHFMGPMPACHLEHVYPPRYQEKHDVYGVKIFFYRAQLISGEISELRNGVDFSWATEDELPDLFSAEYHAAIKPILFGVGP